MRVTFAQIAVVAAALTAAPAIAQPLNPNNFTTIAASFAPTAAVTINTDTLQITGTGFTTVTGVTAAQQNGGPTLAVFDFGSINIPSGATVTLTGTRPFALLSQSSATVAGTINLAGVGTANQGGAVGVAGGGNGGAGSNDAGLTGDGIGGAGGGVGGGLTGGGGGGFGGQGGAGGFSLSSGGISYGNLLTILQAGSGGGGGAGSTDSGGGGASGGGGVQIGAVNSVTVTPSGGIIAGGGNNGVTNVTSGGGGSGGGILLTGNSVSITGLVNAGGGNGGVTSNSSFSDGGGGAGGRIALAPVNFTVGDIAGTLSVSPGTGVNNGQAGVRTLAPATTVVPTGQSLSVASNAIPNFEQFLTSNYSVAGSLTLANSSQTISTLTGSGTVTLTNTTLTVGAGDASGAFAGNITGNGGITKIGLGALTLTGTGSTFSGGLTVSAGTVQGSVASLPTAITDNGNVAFNETAAETFSGSITGAGSVTKLGSGTLTISGSQGYTGGTTVNGGTLSVAADTGLGSAGTPVAVNNGGRLQFIASDATTRTFNLSSGTLANAAGANLTLNGAVVTGGFLRGAGTFTITGGTILSGATTENTAVMNQTGAGAFQNFTNGGTLTITSPAASSATFDGFTNQGSGAITIGPASAVNASDFQTYGLLTLNPGPDGNHITLLTNTGFSPLFFNGGSRTFIGTPQTASQFLAGVDLHGQNAVVAGGLFVNNGFVADSTNNGAGTATVIADFGSLVKGAGFFQNPVITQNGGKFQAGNSPGLATFGNFVLGPGGVNNYIFAINDATGTAGPSPDANGQVSGWGLVRALAPHVGGRGPNGDFTWTATATDRLTVDIDTLINPTAVGTDIAGPMADFDPSRSYVWPAVQWSGIYAGPTDVAVLNADTSFDTSGVVNPIAGTFGWSLRLPNQTLSLIYTPTAVPEPGTMGLVGLAMAGLAWRRISRRPR